MNIILLKGIFPLKEKILLSKYYGIVLDNPNSETEIQIVRNYINANIKYEPGITTDYSKTVLSKLIERDSENKLFDINKILNSKDDSITTLSRIWLIARFDESNIVKRYNDKTQFLLFG